MAIDDFGAGYTSFRNLKALNVDILKLDGSFCNHLAENQENQYFVRSLIDMARKFEFKTIAEWVETPEDAEFLHQWGADYLQGNLFGKASLDIPWRTDNGAPERPRSEDELEAEVELMKASVATAASLAARQGPQQNDEPDMSRLRMAIDALNAQFRRKKE